MQARQYRKRRALPVDWSTLHKVLRDETRKKIILNLQTAGLITYTDLMNRLQITNTGKLNYHLKTLGDLVAKNDQGAYMLTERGKAAAELLEKFPSEMNSTKTLHVFDAVLIGLVGLLLTAIPLFLPATAILAIPLLLYLLLIPSFVMWRLTTRRTNSHDLYELMKPPVLALSISYFIILLVVILPRILASPPPPNTTPTTTTEIIGVASVVWYFLFPLIPPLGVLVIEGVYRFRSR